MLPAGRQPQWASLGSVARLLLVFRFSGQNKTKDNKEKQTQPAAVIVSFKCYMLAVVIQQEGRFSSLIFHSMDCPGVVVKKQTRSACLRN